MVRPFALFRKKEKNPQQNLFSHIKSSSCYQVLFHRFSVFRIKHYAGSVTYCASGFLAKNTDVLDRDLCSVMFSAHHPLLRTLFPEGNYRPCRYSLLLAKHIIKARLGS